MARENSSGLGVNTRYGPISIPDGARGSLHSDSGLIYLTADWSADLINSDSINAAITVVKNILPLRAWVEVEEALSLSGAGASLCFGVQGSLGTNSADISGTSTGVGFKACSLNGTFSTGITATTTLVIGLKSGSINGGAGRFVVECLKV
jgi:hypothetical protein